MAIARTDKKSSYYLLFFILSTFDVSKMKIIIKQYHEGKSKEENGFY